MIVFFVSALPSPKYDSEEEIARAYVDPISSRFKGSSFVFLDYRDATYPAVAKFIEIKGKDKIHIVRLDRLYGPPAVESLVKLVLKKRPGVVRLQADSNIEFRLRFYAKLKDSGLVKLTNEEYTLAYNNDTI